MFAATLQIIYQFHIMPNFAKLNNIYWRLRAQRNKNLRRKYYRYAAVEKKRLIDSGVDPEELRLYCRALSGRLNVHAEKRLQAYRTNMIKDRISS